MKEGSGTRRELRALFAAVRRRWRRRTLVRGVVAGFAAGAVGVVLLVAGGAAGIVPEGARALARWLPLAALLCPVTWAIVRALRAPPDERTLALRTEEAYPGFGHLPSILLDLPPEHPYAPELLAQARRHLGRVRPAHLLAPSLRGREATAVAGVLALAVLALSPAGGPFAAWSDWGGNATAARGAGPTSPGGLEATTPDADLLREIRIVVTPPSYTGLSPFEWEDGELLGALEGSRIRVEGPADPARPLPTARVVRAGEGAGTGPLGEAADGADADRNELASTATGSPGNAPGWRAEWTLGEGDRGLLLSALREGEPQERVVPLDPQPDPPPRVELLEPERDMTLATGSGELAFRARAEDAFGIDAFELTWVHTRGSGESFDFREGSRALDRSSSDEGAVEGALVLDLEEIGLGPGDVLHLRATATDRNDATGPGTGVSRTRQIRIVREGEEMQVDALIGLPLEAEREPVLSQRMILLMTEDLVERAPALDDEEVERGAIAIAREQGRLRAEVGGQIYSRATGAMEEDISHLGTDHAHDTDEAHAAEDLRADGREARGPEESRYGVASVFDPAVEEEPEPPTEAALPTEGIAPDEAGTTVGNVTLGNVMGPAGFGIVQEIEHDHDGDPILSVNRPMLEIHDAMWESERFLRLVDPDGSIPHQLQAIEELQALRENERVFPRGTVTVPPVDVPGVRGTGELDEADPDAREEGAARPGAARRVGEIEGLLAGAADGVVPPSRLTALAVSLLGDADAPAGAGALVARAAGAAERGADAEAREHLRETIRLLDPNPARAGRPSPVRAPSGPVSARWAGAGAGSADGGAEEPATDAGAARPFVFATLRYESGNWDSAPLVPQNLIHALAQYTELPVEPEGVIVDLSSPEIFEYPTLYLTGHLPVRFSEEEARNLEAYVERGGFVFIDDHNHDLDGAFHRTATAELERIFGEGSLAPLPNDHELYRTFFRFDDGPPATSHELSGWGDGLIHPELHAVRVGGRIGVLYSNKDYSSEWNYHAVNKRFLARDNTRFGVNVLLYALTR